MSTGELMAPPTPRRPYHPSTTSTTPPRTICLSKKTARDQRERPDGRGDRRAQASREKNITKHVVHPQKRIASAGEAPHERILPPPLQSISTGNGRPLEDTRIRNDTSGEDASHSPATRPQNRRPKSMPHTSSAASAIPVAGQIGATLAFRARAIIPTFPRKIGRRDHDHPDGFGNDSDSLAI